MKKDEFILMGHGGGGALTGNLINNLIVKELGNPILNKLDDGACIEINESNLVFTTDSYVIDPIFFPGGDIGKLSVCGTVNDITMQGAAPLYLSLALIIQEGLPLSDLERIVKSIRDTSNEVGVKIVTGDTKVVENAGPGGGIYINTAGIGVRAEGIDVAVSNATTDDVVIISGTIGDHGVAIMNEREQFGMQSSLASDAAPLWGMIKNVLNIAPTVHCLRDPTRGGIAAALCDIAKTSKHSIKIDERSLPIKEEVKGACSLLGLDTLNVANEGKAIIICTKSDKNKVLENLQKHPLGKDACIIGEVLQDTTGKVIMTTPSGGERIVQTPAGEDLPRIC